METVEFYFNKGKKIKEYVKKHREKKLKNTEICLKTKNIKLSQKERLKKGKKKADWREATLNKINKISCYRQPYSTCSSLSRAANKIKIMLPNSPSKSSYSKISC